ncbi:MAG: cation transporter [Micropepsaceae bacterium]
MAKHLILAASLFVLAFVGLTGGFAFWPSSADTGQNATENLATATFAVENMTCGACPITVKKAMLRVAGVRSVQIDFEKKIATVVFDRSVASPEAIAAAATNAGYPARLAKLGYSR